MPRLRLSYAIVATAIGSSLFAASGLAVFLSMKHVFDKADRTR